MLQQHAGPDTSARRGDADAPGGTERRLEALVRRAFACHRRDFRAATDLLLELAREDARLLEALAPDAVRDGAQQRLRMAAVEAGALRELDDVDGRRRERRQGRDAAKAFARRIGEDAALRGCFLDAPTDFGRPVRELSKVEAIALMRRHRQKARLLDALQAPLPAAGSIVGEYWSDDAVRRLQAELEGAA